MLKGKIMSVLITLVILISIFCGQAFAEDNVLSMWTREDNEALLRPAVKIFNEKDNNIKIEVRSIPGENFSDAFMAALAADTAPDIVSVDLVLFPYFSSIGAFKNITDQYESLEFKDQFIESMLHLGSRDNSQYGLPFSADVSALIYNKDHFREVGLDPERPPKTWDELIEYSKLLTNNNKYGYVYAGGDAGGHMFTFMPYVWGNGGQVLNEDGTEALLDSEESIEALDLFVDLTRKYQVTPSGVTSYSYTQMQDAFTSENASMLVTGNFVVNAFNNNHPDLDYGVALIPKNDGKSHSSFSGGELIAIPHSSEYENEAWEFMKFAFSEEIQIDTWAKNGVIPVREDFFDNEYFRAEPKYQVFTESLTFSNVPYTTSYNEMYNPILASIQNAINGEISAKEAFETATVEINRIINR